jgi:glutathione peroxidase
MSQTATTAFDFSLTGLDGRTIDLDAYRGRPILIANTASECGFTSQYEGLQSVWTRWRDSGLVVIAVPSNDFGQQEPGDAEQIGRVCYSNYGVSFPVAAKSPVKGAHAIPLFSWLARQGGFLARPRWNFYKYIIGRDGTLATWFSSISRPDSERVQSAVMRVVLDH